MSTNTYALIDSGDDRRLETLGPYVIERQASSAFWKKRNPKNWGKIDALHHRSQTGGGHWELKSAIPEMFEINFGGLNLNIKLTSFGHFGFFPEQLSQWAWLRQSAALVKQKTGNQPKIINLFGYTGCSSLALASGGAEVTHVDAAKGIVDWAKENSKKNDLSEGSVRWIVEDCLVYLKREARRGNLYDGFVMDPPSFGRGPNKEVFKIESDIQPLLEALSAVIRKDPLIFHFSCHTPGFTPEVLLNLMRDQFAMNDMQIDGGEMLIPEKDSLRSLPSGVFVRGRAQSFAELKI